MDHTTAQIGGAKTMSKTFERILKTRAEYFSGLVSALRDSLQDRGIEPTDDALVNVAVQLYAIEPDESEIYSDDDAETEDEEW
ncbi:MAG: hypothetical protein P1V97_02430 [Planctomycetota bacterium]|nr:hypothetical protein [Planctomycetota bacterium]